MQVFNDELEENDSEYEENEEPEDDYEIDSDEDDDEANESKASTKDKDATAGAGKFVMQQHLMWQKLISCILNIQTFRGNWGTGKEKKAWRLKIDTFSSELSSKHVTIIF